MLFVPWICDDNYEHSMNMLRTSTAEIVMGHLEIKGIEMQNGVINEHGNEIRKILKDLKELYQVTFINIQMMAQIYYLNAQYEMTWSDYKVKIFHIFDTETREITKIPNTRTIHKKIIYDDKKHDYTTLI